MKMVAPPDALAIEARTGVTFATIRDLVDLQQEAIDR